MVDGKLRRFTSLVGEALSHVRPGQLDLLRALRVLRGSEGLRWTVTPGKWESGSRGKDSRDSVHHEEREGTRRMKAMVG